VLPRLPSLDQRRLTRLAVRFPAVRHRSFPIILFAKSRFPHLSCHPAYGSRIVHLLEAVGDVGLSDIARYRRMLHGGQDLPMPLMRHAPSGSAAVSRVAAALGALTAPSGSPRPSGLMGRKCTYRCWGRLNLDIYRMSHPWSDELMGRLSYTDRQNASALKVLLVDGTSLGRRRVCDHWIFLRTRPTRGDR